MPTGAEKSVDRAERKWLAHGQTEANDPKGTSLPSLFREGVRRGRAVAVGAL